MTKTDILIIGTGIAGLSFAIKTAKKRSDLSITIMTKAEAETSNTRHAQGGIATVIDKLNDSFQQHINDTLISGGGDCDEEIVKMVVHQAPERLEELIQLGVSFDKRQSDFDLALEGGHSQRRILHHSDMTGFEIEKKLLNVVSNLQNVKILEHHFVIDLLRNNDGECVGAFYLDDENRIRYIRSKVTVLSTGGCGQIFKHTTNAEIATGDGVAIAKRAHAEIRDMQYIQFHPTAMYEPGRNPYFLLSEALRGSGAYIVNEEGKRFVFRYDLRGELATRDIVSKAIIEEIQISGKKYVYLDCRHLDKNSFEKHFKSIAEYFRTKAIDPFAELIPIVPVAHYQCGGISVDKFGRTTVAGLYAIGECARTGLHGRNRLASNSLLEAVVFAHQASQSVCEAIDGIEFSSKVYLNKFDNTKWTGDQQKIDEIKSNLQSVMAQFYIDDAHEKALFEIKILEEIAGAFYLSGDITKTMIELINMLTVASLIIEQSKINNVIINKLN